VEHFSRQNKINYCQIAASKRMALLLLGKTLRRRELGGFLLSDDGETEMFCPVSRQSVSKIRTGWADKVVKYEL